MGLRGFRHVAICLVGVIVAAAVTALSSAAAMADRQHGWSSSTSDRKASAVSNDDTLSDETGLSVTIDTVSPAQLTPHKPVVLTGSVSNTAESTWFENKVYFTITNDPATTKGGLDDFAATGDTAFGDTLFVFGLFDDIGDLEPGQSKPYKLKIPWDDLPIGTAPPGVYHVGASVLAEQQDILRDNDADARADTLISYLPDNAASRPARFLTMVPLTAPVARQADGLFVDEELAAQISAGGALRNTLDLLNQSPPSSMEVVADPALLSAISDMAQGYQVQSLPDLKAGEEPSTGVGEAAARAWMADFTELKATQKLSLLPWGNPDASALADADLPRVYESGVRASRRYASSHGFNSTIVDWQPGAQSTRRGLTVAQAATVSVHVVNQLSLTRLTPEDSNGYPPPAATLDSRRGPLTAVVARSDLAGEPFDPTLSALDFRQRLMAETTIRALSSTPEPVSVIAAPFGWNPGDQSATVDLNPITAPVDVLPTGLLDTNEQLSPQQYAGPIAIVDDRAFFSFGVLEAIGELRDNGRVFVDLLTVRRQAAQLFDQQLAMSGSVWWEVEAVRGEALTRRQSRDLAAQTASVTLTVPTFVALSSNSGRFPVTVTNGLDASITVNINLVPANPALEIDPVDPLVLDPGQRVDIEMTGRSQGSGLTNVRARLTTETRRPFGEPQDFDVRATQIGLAIWIVMGVLGALLFSSAAIRIVKRMRSGGFKPRGETNF